MAFYWLSSTSENYLEPAVSKVSKVLRFSESLAGVTLLALANGAPDIIASYTANEGEGSEGIPLALGALFGAGVFTTSIILGRVVLNSESIDLIPGTFKRDVLFYILIDIVLLVLGWIGKITFWNAVMIFMVYTLFVIKAVYDEMNPPERNLEAVSLTSLPDIPNEIEFSESDVNEIKAELEKHQNVLSLEIEKPGEHNPKKEFNSNLHRKPHSFRGKFILGHRDLKIFLTENQVSERKETVLSKIFNAYEFICDLLRTLTIPSVEEEKYLRLRVAGYPLFTTFFIFWRIGYLGEWCTSVTSWVIFLNFALTGSLFLYILSGSKSFVEKAGNLFVFIGFVVSVFWIHLSAEFLMDFLHFIEISSGLPANFIGLTILAWGNSTNDYFVDVALAKKGYGIMAIAGIFAGQFLNLTIGFGIVLMKKTLQTGTLEFTLFDGSEINNLTLLLVGSSIASLLMSLIYAIIKKYRLTKSYGYYLYGFYGLFFMIVLIISFY